MHNHVLSTYCLILFALWQMLVMRLRFFKIVWHDIKLVIVVVGLMDLVVVKAVGDSSSMEGGSGHLFIRIFFIFSRLIRLMGLIEVVPVSV
jgi:hypothetical protein